MDETKPHHSALAEWLKSHHSGKAQGEPSSLAPAGLSLAPSRLVDVEHVNTMEHLKERLAKYKAEHEARHAELPLAAGLEERLAALRAGHHAAPSTTAEAEAAKAARQARIEEFKAEHAHFPGIEEFKAEHAHFPGIEEFKAEHAHFPGIEEFKAEHAHLADLMSHLTHSAAASPSGTKEGTKEGTTAPPASAAKPP